MALGRQHHLVEILRKHRGGEKGDGAKRLLAGIFEIVPHRCRQDEDAARPNLMRGTVLEVGFALPGDDVLRLIGGVGVPAEPAAWLDL
jgi:hypothetical protein